MPPPLLVLVLGLPGVGKTTLGQRLAAELRLPFFYRDGLKEVLYDSLGWDDRAETKRYGPASYELLYYAAERLLAAGQAVMLESNFDPAHATARLRALQARCPFTPVQLHCTAPGERLYQRYQARAESGARHPGHYDHLNLIETSHNLLTAASTPLDLGGTVIAVDTNDFAQIDYVALLAALRARP